MELWQDAAKTAAELYKLMETSKLKNNWGLKDQLRKVACSIPNTITEGYECDNNTDFKEVLKYAQKSIREVRNQLFILKEAGFIDSKEYKEAHSRVIWLSDQISEFKKCLVEVRKK